MPGTGTDARHRPSGDTTGRTTPLPEAARTTGDGLTGGGGTATNLGGRGSGSATAAVVAAATAAATRAMATTPRTAVVARQLRRLQEPAPGITDDKITIANASDISGPVPGLFESAQQATQAYVAYFNSTSDICGRKLDVALLDTRTDAGADQQAYTKACDEAFATVGSMSAFDSGGAATAQGCGLPDIRSRRGHPGAQRCTTCFGAQAINAGRVPERGAATSSRRTTRTPPSTPRCSTSTPAPRAENGQVEVRGA